MLHKRIGYIGVSILLGTVAVQHLEQGSGATVRSLHAHNLPTHFDATGSDASENNTHAVVVSAAVNYSSFSSTEAHCSCFFYFVTYIAANAVSAIVTYWITCNKLTSV